MFSEHLEQTKLVLSSLQLPAAGRADVWAHKNVCQSGGSFISTSTPLPEFPFLCWFPDNLRRRQLRGTRECHIGLRFGNLLENRIRPVHFCWHLTGIVAKGGR